MDTERDNELATTEGLDQELLASLSQETSFDAEEYASESKAKKGVAAYDRAAQAVWDRTEALKLPSDNPVVGDIYANLSVGQLDRATLKLKKLEAVRAEEIDRKAEERVRQQMASQEAPGGTPEGAPEGEVEGTTSGNDPRARYIRGEITAAEANKLGAGLM